ncbi:MULTISPECIES: hypothetical protein [Bacteroidales]|uniref:hypothetical protein n=1 Tax=Bacteroidales TaxID=171549 RepID=UPI001F28548E|nr:MULTISPECIES: hypothetical protein [Bacteroidales]
MIAFRAVQSHMCHYPFEAVAAQKDFCLLAYPVHAVVKRMSLVKFTGLYIHVNFKIMMVIDALFQHNLKKGRKRNIINIDGCHLLLKHNGNDFLGE